MSTYKIGHLVSLSVNLAFTLLVDSVRVVCRTLLEWLWQHKLTIDALDIHENTFPVGHRHANHVFHIQEWYDSSTLPIEQKPQEQ